MRFALVCCVVLGCSGAKGDLPPNVGDCGDRPTIEGVCAGVPETTVCADELCTAEVACAKTWTVRDPASLSAATGGAASGDCLALAPGTYGDLALRGGVHVLGRGAGVVTVGSVTFTGTGASTVRGVSVVAGSLTSKGVDLTVDQVAVRRAAAAAISVQDASLSLSQSTVEKGGASGVVVRCADACTAGKRPRMVVRRTWVHEQKVVGILGASIDADLRDVVIDHTGASSFTFGRGLEVNGRSTLVAPYLRVEDCADLGVAVFTSVGTLGPGLEIRRTVRGLALQSVPDGGLVLDGFEVEDTFAVALSVQGASRGVVVRNGSLFGTRLLRVPVAIGGMEEIGDGLEWGGQSEVSVESSVRIKASSRRPAVIVPTAKGTFAAQLLEDDAAHGVFVLDPGGASTHPALTFAPGIKVEYGDKVPLSTEPSSVKP